MEILQLRYFYESAKTESFARTAEKYKVPATSVSASVKRLEKELGCELFDRTCNRILLNDKGRGFYDSIKSIFDELDKAIISLKGANSDIREIKILARAMRGEITERIIEYKTKNPHIKFKTVFDFNEMNVENYDIIIDEESDRYPDCERFLLYETQIRLCASETSPLCHKRWTLKQLSDQPFISIGENNGLHRILIKACKKAGFNPNIEVLSNDVSCLNKCIAAGVGIGLAREYSGRASRKNTRILDVLDFNEKQSIFSYYKKSSAYGNVEHFLNFLRSKVV